jgi:hypothetical protein
MSSNLTAEPLNRKKKNFGTELKFALRKRYGEPICAELSKSHIDYLQGLYDSGIKEAKILIEMIEKYQNIIVKEEY